jgi:alcohol dehydrogenase
MDISKTYALSLAPRILFGVGTVQQAGGEASRLGITHALVVTDGGLVQTDIPGKVTKALDDAGVKWTLFGEVEPNPSIGTVHKGLEVYTRQQCDGLVAVGGGSPIDAAKAIGMLATNGGNIREYFGADRIKKPLPPLVAIPTTCGTGSEVTQFTVITDTESHFKMGIGSPHNIPKVAIVDPALLAKLPGRMVAATGMDALCHAIESYTSQAAQFLSDTFSLRAIELIGRHLRPAVANGNLTDLTGMAMASTLAGLGFNNTRTTLVHAMSHAVTAHAQVPHGIANAILVRYVMEFNLIGNPEKHADIGAALGEDTDGLLPMEAGHVAVDAVRELADDVGIPQTLREVNVTEAMLEPMTDSALKAVMGVALNPRRPSREDVVTLYRSALSGC